MLRVFVPSLILCLLGIVALTPIPDGGIGALEKHIQQEFGQVEGSFSLAFQHLDETDLHLYMNADTLVHAASTYKTAVMIEVFRQAEEGRFSMNDSLLITNEFRSIVDGSSFEVDPVSDGGSDLYDHLGERVPIRTVTRNMIVRSGNLATNLLIDKVGAESVTATMRSLGAERIQIRRCYYQHTPC